MGNCATFFDELRFDVRDPEATHVYAFVRGEGDCPFFVHGWHHKAFPKDMMTHEIMTLLAEGKEDMMQWEREVPRAQPEITLFNPHEFVPIRAEDLMAWRASLLGSVAMSQVDIADAITAWLAMSPEWRKACPYCRAEDAMLLSLRNPPQ